MRTSKTNNNSNNTVIEDIIPSQNYSDTKEEDWSDFDDGEYFSDDMGDDSGIIVYSDVQELEKLSREPIKEKPSKDRIVKTSIMGVFTASILSLIIICVYGNIVRFPKREEIIQEQTGIHCLNNWVASLKSMESLGSESYINQEIVYANGSELKVNFYKRMLSTVAYTPKVVNVKNVYGNDYIDKKTRSAVSEPSDVKEGEEVSLSYIDYENIVIDETLLSTIMLKYNLKIGDVDYENKLVDVFCEYMCTIYEDTIPIKSIDYVPNIVKNSKTGYYSVFPEEDVYIDKLLFSSQEFRELLIRFSEVASKVSGNVELVPTEEWSLWDSLSDEQKKVSPEPSKYSYKQVISKTWCGVYYLQNEYELKDSQGNVIKKGVSANIGDGTFGNPASLDTGIITSIFVNEQDEEGKEVVNEYPIKVILRDYKVSEDAIHWFESKDERNRGIDVKSEVQYCAYSIEVVNLSSKELVITDNTSLCDQNANLFPRSGEMFGLNSTLTLQPDQSGIIESWGKSTELNRKYLIWGSDFARRKEPVWFRVLSGDMEDDSEEKGVNLNKSRNSSEETSQTENIQN